MEAHGALRGVRRRPRDGEARLPARPACAIAQGPDAAVFGVVASDLVVGRLFRPDGDRQLVRRLSFLDRRLGELQSMGRYRSVSVVRAGAGHRAGALRLRADAVNAAATLEARLGALAPIVLEITDDSAQHAGHA